ncbi:hypothetical protein EDB81DRAFT_830686 [Dactylonectria macrodidyma]|uniref:Zn(2)-C6 fungal-type domain-containing protein n=1 Tax=Dactylonectria macrodidyma TaxID=307937 RepID=A0A9P9D2B5_9HYPO|nr:hypothetical protein EDB81DRAFT_830686 [Dactylonectria macrodidyma]
MSVQTDGKEQLASQRKKGRSFHRRSRNGCLECKKRHIRCDETTPRCVVCTTARRKCSYQSHIRSFTSPGTAHPGELILTFQGNEVGCANSRGDAAECRAQVPQLGPMQINMMHLQLFHHFNISTFDAVWSPGPDLGIHKRIIMKHATSNPVLAHEVLALSARHLSIIRTDGDKLYYRQAMELQCQAISMFNILSPQDMAENWVPTFIFSHILGVHTLCDVLAYRNSESDAVLDKFVSYCHLHRGVLQIAQGGWCELLDSELGPLLRLPEGSFTPQGAGHNFEQLLHTLSLTKLRRRHKEACRRAIYHLRDIIGNKDAVGGCGASLLRWILLVPAEFVSLLEMRRQEALAILACYVGMLRLAEGIWLIGDSWQYLLHSIMACLDSEWAPVVTREQPALRSTNRDEGVGRKCF